MYIGQNIKATIKKINNDSLQIEYKGAKCTLNYDDILDYQNYNLKDIFQINEPINVKIIAIFNNNNFGASFKTLHSNFSKLQSRFLIKETLGGFNKLINSVVREYNE